MKLLPNKMQVFQVQMQANKTERLDFAQKISKRIEDNLELLGVLLFNDEVYLHLSGHVNKQNVRFWATEQPPEHMDKPLSVEKTTVWCAVGKSSIFDP